MECSSHAVVLQTTKSSGKKKLAHGGVSENETKSLPHADVLNRFITMERDKEVVVAPRG